MGKPVRVLHVLGGLSLGGAESRIMDLYRCMDREKVQFDFLVHQNGAGERIPEFYDKEVRELGGNIYVLPRLKGYNYLAYKRAVKKFFSEHWDFRVVQGHMTSTAAIYLPEAARAGIPVRVAHARSAGVDKGIKGMMTRLLRIPLLKRADYCFACSELAGEDVFGRDAMRQGRVKIIHNAVDVDRFTYDPRKRAKVREELGLGEELTLGHVGRFNYQKNHPYLIDIFAALCENRTDAVLLLLGEGPDQESIREKCRLLGIENKVRFLGNQKHPEDYYQAMDIFLLPSFFEGLPGVLVEAQAAGLRCLVSDTVTREAQATDLVTYLSIERPAGEWAKKIQTEAGYERQDTCQTMRDAGFDVKTQAEGYRLFYRKGDTSRL